MEYSKVLLDLKRVAEKKEIRFFPPFFACPRICIEWDLLKFSIFRIQQRIYSTTFNVNAKTWDCNIPPFCCSSRQLHHSISSCLYLMFFDHCSSISASKTSTKSPLLFDIDILLLRFLRNLRHSRGPSLFYLSLETLLDWLFLLFAISVTPYFYR